MTKVSLMRRIRQAREKVRQGIESNKFNLFSLESDTEGFSGGYMSALDDVMLLSNDVQPKRNYWNEWNIYWN